MDDNYLTGIVKAATERIQKLCNDFDEDLDKYLIPKVRDLLYRANENRARLTESKQQVIEGLGAFLKSLNAADSIESTISALNEMAPVQLDVIESLSRLCLESTNPPVPTASTLPDQQQTEKATLNPPVTPDAAEPQVHASNFRRASSLRAAVRRCARSIQRSQRDKHLVADLSEDLPPQKRRKTSTEKETSKKEVLCKKILR
jgi:hypothetical protein